MTNTKILVAGLFITLGFAAYLFWPAQQQDQPATPIADIPPVESETVLHAVDNPEAIPVTMYKNPGCGCCTKWAQHMVSDEHFEVKEIASEDVYEIKEESGIPATLSSCHTAKIGKYVVEGHVPAEDVKRLLEEQPDAIGLTVPGMPIGSPGMEVPGRQPQRYDVLLIKRDGTTEVFASH